MKQHLFILNISYYKCIELILRIHEIITKSYYLINK